MIDVRKLVSDVANMGVIFVGLPVDTINLDAVKKFSKEKGIFVKVFIHDDTTFIIKVSGKGAYSVRDILKRLNYRYYNGVWEISIKGSNVTDTLSNVCKYAQNTIESIKGVK